MAKNPLKTKIVFSLLDMSLTCEHDNNVDSFKIMYLQNRAARIITANFDWSFRGITCIECMAIVRDLAWLVERLSAERLAALTVYKCLVGYVAVELYDLYSGYFYFIKRYCNQHNKIILY